MCADSSLVGSAGGGRRGARGRGVRLWVLILAEHGAECHRDFPEALTVVHAINLPQRGGQAAAGVIGIWAMAS